jgi:prephenate dehydrogenase
MNFGTVAILGPGLIGGSLALALNERGLTDKLVIWARNENSFSAIRKKLPHVTLTTDIIEAVRDADIVVLCVPIETMKGLVEKFADSLKSSEVLVTDVGSVKESVDNAIAPLLKDKALWMGSHPMAGSEKSGFSAARADLFTKATVIVTPPNTSQISEQIFCRLRDFWQSVGGSVAWIEPDPHDIAVAEISHVPHLLAAFMAATLTDEGKEFVGKGFLDTTRIASGSPELWKEILWDNRSAVAAHLTKLINLSLQTQEWLKNTEPEKAKSEIYKLLKKAKDKRTQLITSISNL